MRVIVMDPGHMKAVTGQGTLLKCTCSLATFPSYRRLNFLPAILLFYYLEYLPTYFTYRINSDINLFPNILSP